MSIRPSHRPNLSWADVAQMVNVAPEPQFRRKREFIDPGRRGPVCHNRANGTWRTCSQAFAALGCRDCDGACADLRGFSGPPPGRGPSAEAAVSDLEAGEWSDGHPVRGPFDAYRARPDLVSRRVEERAAGPHRV